MLGRTRKRAQQAQLFLDSYTKRPSYNDRGIARMIAQLSGTLAGIEGNSVIVDVNGVGYQVFVPVTVRSTLSVEELTRALSTNDTRLITKVPGVGPKLAQRLCLVLN
jgi:Holliday junction resolvasome RuvABC DNA-binding subunit